MYTISELKINNNHLDIFKAKIDIDALKDSKSEYKKWYYWKSLPGVVENETEELDKYIYGIRNTSTVRDIDFDYNKYLRLEVANKITGNVFPSTMTYGRNGIGHNLFEVINPVSDPADEKIFFGNRTILEFRSVGAFQVLKGKLDDNGANAKISSLKITQIEYYTLKKKFYEAGMLAQMLIGCPGDRNVLDAYLKPLIGEMGWAGIKVEDAERYIELFCNALGREDRIKESCNSVRSYYKNERFTKLLTKDNNIEANCLWSKQEIKHFTDNLKKLVGKKEDSFKLSKITTGEEVWATEETEVKQIIKNYFCEGLTIVAGRPKGGKSWLMLNAALSVESDLKFLGQEVQKSRCLYYALEDNSRRMKRRWAALGMSDKDSKPDVIYLKDLQHRLGDGLEKEIEIRIKQNGYKFIVIDTLAKARSEKSTGLKTQYDIDTKSLTGLQEIGLKYGVAVVAIHHTRKPDKNGEQDEFDAISGTSGIQGVADTLIVITSKRKKTGNSKLFLTSRDMEPLEKEISQNADFWWEIIGDADKDNAGKITMLKQNILAAVKWWTVKDSEFAEKLLYEEDAVKRIPKNENIVEACTPKQICEYFALAEIRNNRGEAYKETTIKKEAQRMRDTYSQLAIGETPGTYKLPNF